MKYPPMDFPQAWEFVRTTKLEDHHVKCSWHSGMLCDCNVLWAEYYKRAAEMSESVLSMTVARLGGIVEGNPTGRHNFLQRIDELIAIEFRAPSPVPAPDPVCEQLYALMELACADIIFFHEQGHPFVGPETPELPAKVAFSVMVNDLFVPAADAEGFDITEAIPLRDVFRKDGYEGVVRWVQAKRDNMPLRPHVEKRIKEKQRGPEPVREKLIEALRACDKAFGRINLADLTNDVSMSAWEAQKLARAALALAEESK